MAGAVLIVVGVVRDDLTSVAIGAGFVGVPGLSAQTHHTVVVLRNGNGKGTNGSPPVG